MKQSSPEKHALIMVSNVNTFACSDCISAEQHNSLIRDLLHWVKLLISYVSIMLSRVQSAVKNFFHSRPGMIDLWVPHAVLIPCSGGITNKILFCRQHPVSFRIVNIWIQFEHVLDLAHENYQVCLPMAAVVWRRDDNPLYRQFNGMSHLAPEG